MKRPLLSHYGIDGQPDADGWWDVERFALDGSRDHARVRMQPDEHGRLEIHELHLLDNGQPITADRLRAYNLGTIGRMIDASALINEQSNQPKRRRSLRAPTSRGYDDAFYERVADAYRAALARGARPVAAIAAEAGVPRSTAARGVNVARRRPGVSLGAGTPGKAGEARG
jgi:hypothetical protein